MRLWRDMQLQGWFFQQTPQGSTSGTEKEVDREVQKRALSRLRELVGIVRGALGFQFFYVVPSVLIPAWKNEGISPRNIGALFALSGMGCAILSHKIQEVVFSSKKDRLSAKEKMIADLVNSSYATLAVSVTGLMIQPMLERASTSFKGASVLLMFTSIFGVAGALAVHTVERNSQKSSLGSTLGIIEVFGKGLRENMLLSFGLYLGSMCGAETAKTMGVVAAVAIFAAALFRKEPFAAGVMTLVTARSIATSCIVTAAFLLFEKIWVLYGKHRAYQERLYRVNIFVVGGVLISLASSLGLSLKGEERSLRDRMVQAVCTEILFFSIWENIYRSLVDKENKESESVKVLPSRSLLGSST